MKIKRILAILTLISLQADVIAHFTNGVGNVWLDALSTYRAWAATTRYVSPSGSGSNCLTGDPCSVATGMAATVAGDTLLFKSGNYVDVTIQPNPSINGTPTDRILYMSEVRHGAVIQPPSNGRGFEFRGADYYTIKGFKIDGRNGLGGFTSLIGGGTSSTVNSTIGLIMEDNLLVNSNRAGIQLSGPYDDCIVRFNEINGTGYSSTTISFGEGLYLSTSSSTQTNNYVDGCEFYGNTIKDTTNNMVDLKNFSRNNNIHHNIFEDHKLRSARGTPNNGADDGMIKTPDGIGSTANNRFDNNIVRNSTGGVAVVHTEGIQLHGSNNVFYNLSAPDMWQAEGNAGQHVWSNNTACNTPTTNDSNPTNSITLTNNLMNQDQSVCDAEVARIIGEISQRPKISAIEIGLVAADKIRATWVVDKFPPLASVDNAKLTCTVAGVGRTVTSSIIIGQNTTEHTLASAVTAGQSVVCVGTLGLVVNNGRVGSTYFSDLADSAAFTTGTGGVPSVVNNVGGSPSSATIAQSRARCYLLYGATDGSWRPIATDDTCNITVPAGSKLILVAKLRGENADPSPFNPRLRYDLDGGGYTEIPTDFSADNIKALGTGIQPGTVVAEGPLAAGDRLTSDEATNIACAFVRTASSIPNLDLSQDSEAECAWAIEFDADAAGVYSFRVYTDTGITLDSYTGGPGVGVTPTITIGRNSALY